MVSHPPPGGLIACSLIACHHYPQWTVIANSGARYLESLRAHLKVPAVLPDAKRSVSKDSWVKEKDVLSSLTSNQRLTTTKLPGPEIILFSGTALSVHTPVHFLGEKPGSEEAPTSATPCAPPRHSPLMGQHCCCPATHPHSSSLQTGLLLEPSLFLSNKDCRFTVDTDSL